jgi:hypothetical protein
VVSTKVSCSPLLQVLDRLHTLQTYGHVIPGMHKDAATVADLILGGTQKGSGTVVPDPSANNSPLSDSPRRRWRANALLSSGGGGGI